MSQAKVDQYKKKKQNRKKEFRKEKFERFLASCAAVLVLGAVGVWCGYSVYNTIQANADTVYTDVNLDAINDYTSTLGE